MYVSTYKHIYIVVIINKKGRRTYINSFSIREFLATYSVECYRDKQYNQPIDPSRFYFIFV